MTLWSPWVTSNKKNWDIHISYRYNGFGFMCLKIGDWYGLQIGTIKLIIQRAFILEEFKIDT